MKKIIIILMCMIVGCIFLQRQQYKKINTLNKSIQPLEDSIKKLNNAIDSLTSEAVNQQIELERYEFIFDRAKAEMTPECQIELENIVVNAQ